MHINYLSQLLSLNVCNVLCFQGRPIDSYVPSHLKEFQIKATQALIVSIHERAEDEVTNAALYARQAQERRAQQDLEDERAAAEYTAAIRNYDVLQAEVDNFVAEQARSARSAVDRAWEAEQEARNELNTSRRAQSQRPPQSSRGRRGRRT